MTVRVVVAARKGGHERWRGIVGDDRLPDDVPAEQDAVERAGGRRSGLPGSTARLPEDVQAEQDREARLGGEPDLAPTHEQIVDLLDEY